MQRIRGDRREDQEGRLLYHAEQHIPLNVVLRCPRCISWPDDASCLPWRRGRSRLRRCSLAHACLAAPLPPRRDRRDVRRDRRGSRCRERWRRACRHRRGVGGGDRVLRVRDHPRVPSSSTVDRRASGAAVLAVRDVVAEFGVAEAADTIVLRPLLMYAFADALGGLIPGVIAGKLVCRRRLLRARHPCLRAARAGTRMSALPVVYDPLSPEALDALRSCRRPSSRSISTRSSERMAPCGGRCRRSGLHYAVKCNPEPALLARLHALGAGFEVASLAELRLLAALGIDARSVLYSNPVKPTAHIAGARALGLDRFAVDSRCELEKLVADAPGARVYVRLDASDPTSRVPLAGKFGVDPATAIELLLEARARRAGAVRADVPRRLAGARPRRLRAGHRAVGRRHARRSQPRPASRAARYRRRTARALHRDDPADRGLRTRRSPTRSRGCRIRSRSWPSPDARSSQRPGCSRRR